MAASERDELAEVPRCPGCGSTIAPSRHTCYPLRVDVTKPGYRYLEGTWGYCLTLSRHVRIGEDWLAQRDQLVAAEALREAASKPIPDGFMNVKRWLRDMAAGMEARP